VFTFAILVFTMTDPGVQVAPISAFTFRRSWRSRLTGARICSPCPFVVALSVTVAAPWPQDARRELPSSPIDLEGTCDHGNRCVASIRRPRTKSRNHPTLRSATARLRASAGRPRELPSAHQSPDGESVAGSRPTC
jgi:hypothetical protein